MDNVEHLIDRAPKGGLFGPACQHFCRTVEKSNGAAGVRGNHRISDTRQRHIEPVPLLYQRRRCLCMRGDIAQGGAPMDLRPCLVRRHEAVETGKEHSAILALYLELTRVAGGRRHDLLAVEIKRVLVVWHDKVCEPFA